MSASTINESLQDWLTHTPLSATEVDCATTVMLKILDGKCKMKPVEKQVMERLYDAVKHQPGVLFHADMHSFIAYARAHLSEDLKLRIYEKRVLAETELSRPVMKAFKARIRAAGLFAACGLPHSHTELS